MFGTNLALKPTNLALKPGKLLRIKHLTKSFWLDGKEPNIVQFLYDDEGRKADEFLSGTNGWILVTENDVLLFLGILPIPITYEYESGHVVADENSSNICHNEECLALKFLIGNKICFWSLAEFNKAEQNFFDIFEVLNK